MEYLFFHLLGRIWGISLESLGRRLGLLVTRLGILLSFVLL